MAILRRLSALAVALLLMGGQLAPIAMAQAPRLRALDTTAGQPAMIMVSGEPNEVVELSFTNPYRSTIRQSFQLNKEGILQYWYPQAVVAGEYQVSFAGESTSFTVAAGLPDEEASKLELSDFTSYVGQALEGKLTLRDHYGNVISSRNLEIEATGVTQVSCLNRCVTDREGVVRFSVSSQKAGMKRLTVLDESTDKVVFREEVGFIPRVQTSQPNSFQQNTMPMNPWAMPYWGPYWNSYPANGQGYIPVQDPFQATYDSQGNSDEIMDGSMSYWGDWGAAQIPDPSAFDSLPLTDEQQEQLNQVLSEQANGSSEEPAEESEEAEEPEQVANTLAQADEASEEPQAFEILFDLDPEAEFEEEVTVPAQSALDFIVRRVDDNGEVITDYLGEVEFELEPSGPLLPSDYSFTELDQGVALFELALVLPVGDFTLTISDKDDPDLKGQIVAKSQFEGTPSLNNTNVELILSSPVSNGQYAGTIAVQGRTSTDNTEVIIQEGGLDLKRGEVSGTDNSFNFPLQLGDGLHEIEITAVYLPDGSQTSTTVSFEIDQTPPVIVSVDADLDPVRAGEPFTITAVADADSKLTAFINNRAYEFQGLGENYTLTAKAPLDPGNYPINLRIEDEIGNSSDEPEVGILQVVEPLDDIQNLFGIPGVGTITLSWNPVEGAEEYDVEYKSILSSSSESISVDSAKVTVEGLNSDVSYIFTVTAKDAQGNDVSLATKSRALKALPAPAVGGSDEPVASIIQEQPDLRGAANVQTTPVRHTASGPEVYLLILASLIVLNVYGRARRYLARSPENIV